MPHHMTTRLKASKRFSHNAIDLGTQTVRLFRILQQTGVVSLQLWHQEFDGRHTALSYVWGPIDPSHHILVNGRPFHIRQNLYDFLVLMRDQGRSDAFFVDAICINQESDSEKNHQVRQMWRMYAEARQVCFWLGSGTSIAKLTDMSLLTWWKPSPEEQDKLGRLVKEVLYCDFWSRTWIVQEVLLGHHHGKIMYGTESHDFVEFAPALESAREATEVGRSPAWQLLGSDLLVPHRTREGQHPAVGPPQPLRHHAAARTAGDSWLSNLLSILDGIFDRTACSDRRDRIFVPMSLLGGAATSMVDYSLSASQLYLRLLSRWVEGEFTGAATATIEAFVQAERVLRRTLGLENASPSRLWKMADKANQDWSVALRFEAIAKVDSILEVFHMLCVSPQTSDRIRMARAFARCHCEICGPEDQHCDNLGKLVLFSPGDGKGYGPHLLVSENCPGIHSIAYGALLPVKYDANVADNRHPLKIIRLAGLRSIDTTALQGAFQFESGSHSSPGHFDGLFFDLKARPSEILKLLWYNLGLHVIEPPESGEIRCDLLTQPGKKCSTKGQAENDLEN
ncbi:uncharacterized protein AB675_2805 [Cyphellophora attinorum]|uniref:Heterokaryon incompatibility domain-containing protein n=1 Tax=Cyphellophora attinorum TaxID=1664694 RepID=A0A0N1HGH5_9EURO|nr:uncharacterized protein AB675_2805 [Phialophora attinorum]KPI45292.1 hypothetical protein AB675_2805 [Phialophora attinorum]